MCDDMLKILFAEYINANPVGGSLHIAYDGGNVSDKDIAFCYRHAEKNGDIAAMVIAGFLLRMKEDERDEFLCQPTEGLVGTFEVALFISSLTSN
ncbi:hypothetical protein ACTLMW_004429 [Enterobacter roggenkampii]